MVMVLYTTFNNILVILWRTFKTTEFPCHSPGAQVDIKVIVEASIRYCNEFANEFLVEFVLLDL